MEVHLPHRPIHGLGEFFLHLFTITVGLLIAVGIEGCVEWRHHLHVAQEARDTIREEIEYNLREVPRMLANEDDQTRAMKSNIDTLNQIRAHPGGKNAQNLSLDMTVNIDAMRDTAWKTAQATGALAYMPYDEAQRYAEIYGVQADFLAAQRKTVEDETSLQGILEKTRLRPDKTITAEEAGLLLERCGIWQGHLFFLHTYTKFAEMEYRAFLENKAPPRAMHEEIPR